MAARLKLMPSAPLILGAGEKAKRQSEEKLSAPPARRPAGPASRWGSVPRPHCGSGRLQRRLSPARRSPPLPPLARPCTVLPCPRYLPSACRTPADMVNPRPPPSRGCEKTSPGPLPPHGSPMRKSGRRALHLRCFLLAFPVPPPLPQSGGFTGEKGSHTTGVGAQRLLKRVEDSPCHCCLFLHTVCCLLSSFNSELLCLEGGLGLPVGLISVCGRNWP